MNNITEKNVREFIDAMNRDALEEVNKIKTETKEFNEREYEESKKRIKSDSEHEKQYEITKIKTQTNREISRLVSESRKEVADKRNNITKQVFSEAENELAAFTKTEKYADFLSMSAAKIKSALGEDNLTLFLREEDMKYCEKIAEETKCTFEIDNTIRIGGLKGKRGNTVADDSLDERLESQLEWFKANSVLTVR